MGIQNRGFLWIYIHLVNSYPQIYPKILLADVILQYSITFMKLYVQVSLYLRKYVFKYVLHLSSHIITMWFPIIDYITSNYKKFDNSNT